MIDSNTTKCFTRTVTFENALVFWENKKDIFFLRKRENWQKFKTWNTDLPERKLFKHEYSIFFHYKNRLATFVWRKKF